MNHQETPQTNPLAIWDPLDVSLNPLRTPCPLGLVWIKGGELAPCVRQKDKKTNKKKRQKDKRGDGEGGGQYH